MTEQALKRLAIKVFNRNGRRFEVWKAANIYRRHRIALWVRSFGVWMNATGLAEVVLDPVFVERVGGNVSFRSQ